jgi:hypothetical protein
MAYCCSLWRWLIKKFMNFDIIQNFLHFFGIIFYTHYDYYLI